MTVNGPAIDIQKLTKVFDDKTVVDNISLKVDRGSVFGFLGSNGSGKTTMIRMICGLLTPTHGAGLCLGYEIRTQTTEIKNKIGYMPQQFSLYDGLTVYETLQFFAAIYQIKDSKEAIEAILTDLELTPFRTIKAGNLSGGWKQRLTLSCCLLHKPELLFLDEPTAGIDPKARKDFWDYLHKISMRDGTTVLVTTHYMDEAEKCTDLAYINLGRLLYSGTTSNLIPFSEVKTYLIKTERQSLYQFSAMLKSAYPKLLISVINNDLRVSSRKPELLAEFTEAQKKYALKEVPPSFEEVFIGLMQ
ncbi:MAG: multidrug ABC transporter [Legionellales bacterium RIFCSPHIGHO2_12_FULL_42_9]|nr:MAG: multidrug ABC transporter [Legionellales bacterium RIFCSPHIGHO2_12_FULL_42_9]